MASSAVVSSGRNGSRLLASSSRPPCECRAARLPVPVIGRLQDGAFLLDLRCLEAEEEFAKNLSFL